MSKPVPPKEQSKQTTSRPASANTPAPPPPKSAGAGDAAARSDAKPQMPQVSRPKATGPPAPSPAQVALRAYQIWIQRGQPDGTDLENWYEAERQLRK